ncbi:MAG: UPF0147 family protein [Nanoarchaeota archaeon]|nr:UPF0147 family protein [Nanoarchaeota archaeon]MBU1005533.1 UPF0147 family protein [Nanoarchaeota archaeon]MBU1946592.1 UPF0147 family protein [Nanoarchaeota archaeon]
MSSVESYNEAIEALKEMESDANIPKNIKLKIQNIIKGLEDPNAEISIKVNKTLSALDELSDDSNLETDIRTQIWNVVSILEKISQ